MPIQSGQGGYDPSLSITEQIALTNTRIASLVTKGREGSSAIAGARKQLADLTAQQTNHVAAQTANKAVLTAHAAANPKGVTSAQPRPDVAE